MSLQTPRVLPAHLHAFHPSSAGARSTHTIRLLGTISALHGDTATITCGGNGDVTLVLRPDSHLQMGKLVEVVGKVMDLEGGQVCSLYHSLYPECEVWGKLIWYIGSWCSCAWNDGLGESGRLWYVLVSDCRVMIWTG